MIGSLVVNDVVEGGGYRVDTWSTLARMQGEARTDVVASQPDASVVQLSTMFGAQPPPQHGSGLGSST